MLCNPGVLEFGTGWVLRKLKTACSVEPETGFGFPEEEAAAPRASPEAQSEGTKFPDVRIAAT